MNARGFMMMALFAVASCGAAAASAEMPREPLYGALQEANTAFQQANAAADPDRAGQLYDRAILLYRKIIDSGGVQNAGLYYNLANAYLLKGDIGQAILNYRRAAKLDGADLNIQKNLAFARSRRVDTVEVRAEKRVLETLFFWHYDLTLRTKVFLACLFFAVLCVSLTAMMWWGRGAVLSTVAVLGGVLLLCFLASTLIETRHQARVRGGVITAPEVVARQGDGPNYPPSFKDPLHTGTEFELLEQRPGWLHIALSDGSGGWIPDDAAGLI
jgi:hypothetical protein